MIKKSGRKNRKSRKSAKTAKISRFSMETALGKSACILLILILTVGAFLAPRISGSLYDAGTLMQTEYIDMNLSTYAVNYSSFEEKLKMIGSIAAYGNSFFALPVNETSQAVSGRELTDIVNREMTKLSESSAFLYREDWWSSLTEENLSGREKETLYVQRNIGEEENELWNEMPSIEFWALTYEISPAQREEMRKQREKEWEKQMQYEVGDEYIKKLFLDGGTEKMTVILDAEFYKIYAVAMDGANGMAYLDGHSFYLSDVSNVVLEQIYEAGGDDMFEVRYNVGSKMLDDWVNYWEAVPADRGIFYPKPALGGEIRFICYPRQNGEAEGSGSEEDGTAREAAVDEAAKYMEAGTVDEAASAGYDKRIAVVDADGVYTDSIAHTAEETANDTGVMEVTLNAGCLVEAERSYEGWVMEKEYIQKYGLMEFFDMIQF